jgi:hypothetical protein
MVAKLVLLGRPHMAHVPAFHFSSIDHAAVTAFALDGEIEPVAHNVAQHLEFEVRAHARLFAQCSGAWQ